MLEEMLPSHKSLTKASKIEIFSVEFCCVNHKLDDPGSVPSIFIGETKDAGRTPMHIECAYSLCQNWPGGKGQGQAMVQVPALRRWHAGYVTLDATTLL